MGQGRTFSVQLGKVPKSKEWPKQVAGFWLSASDI